MDTINNRIADLLESNRKLFDGNPIAFDGVVDEKAFSDSQIRTVFLLKEVNSPNMSEDWITFMEDTKAQTSAESLYSTWPNVCLWMEVLKDNDISYIDCLDESGNFNTKKLQKNLLDVSIVNIKKTAGGGSSDSDEIMDAVKRYGYIIIEEIENIIQPQLVICGGTFEYAKTIFGITPKQVEMFPTGAEYFVHNDILFLRFVHPVWFSVNRNILFAYAKSVFVDVIKKLRVPAAM